MTEPAVNPDRERPSISEALDWRSGHTWGVFLGSAVTMGTAAAIVFSLVAVLILGLPSGAETHAPTFLGAALVLLLFMPFVLVLMKLIRPRPHVHVDGEHETESWLTTAHLKSWLDIALNLLWSFLAILPIFAFLFGWLTLTEAKLSDTASESLTLMCAIATFMVVGMGVLFVPDLLHRWSRPKPLPARYPHEQANAGRERRP